MAKFIRYQGQVYQRVDAERWQQLARKIVEERIAPHFLEHDLMSAKFSAMGKDKFYTAIICEINPKTANSEGAKIFNKWKTQLSRETNMSGLKIHSTDYVVNISNATITLKAIFQQA